jgi:septal ring factor EnvC (AmiA/AmiB activator)
MWEPDRKLYALLFSLWVLLLVASLATVSPEQMYLMTEAELMSLPSISDRLSKKSETLKAEAENWKKNSEALELELENSSVEISLLRTELGALRIELQLQSPRLTELGLMLAASETRAGELARQAKDSATTLRSLEQFIARLKTDLSQMRRSRDIWRILSGVLAVLAGVGWTMILYYP